MINISIIRHSDQSIAAFEVKGHAGYAERGKDIVCAGVSAVTVGTVNAVEALLGVELEAEMAEGFLRVRVPDVEDASKRGQIQLLLESMLVMLNSIRESYGQFVDIRENQTS